MRRLNQDTTNIPMAIPAHASAEIRDNTETSIDARVQVRTAIAHY
jgi:hypothetical protein